MSLAKAVDIGAAPEGKDDGDLNTTIVHNDMLIDVVFLHAIPLTDYAGFIVNPGKVLSPPLIGLFLQCLNVVH